MKNIGLIILCILACVGVSLGQVTPVGGYLPLNSSKSFTAGNATFSNVIARGTLSVAGTSTLSGGGFIYNATNSLSILTNSYSSTIPAIWMGTACATPSTSNYSILKSNTSLQFNDGNRIRFNYIDATIATVAGSGLYLGGNSVPSSYYLSFAAGNATLAPINLPSQTDYSVANNGSIWYNSTSGFNFLGVALKTKHLVGSSAAPTIASGSGLGTGAGTVVSVTNATDMSGIIGVVTGTASLGTSAVLATLTFNLGYNTAPNVQLTPANLAAANLAIGSNVYVSSTTSSLSVNTNTTALTAATTYSWFYHVIQ